MKTVTLLFNSKDQLFDYYSTLGKVVFAMDVKKLILSSALSPTDVLCAVKKYDAQILFAKLNPSATELAFC